jgi:hypothetical protein
MIVGSRAEKCGEIAGGSLFRATAAEPVQDVGFRHGGRNVEQAIETVFGGDRLEELIHRIQPDRTEHLAAIFRRFWEITHDGVLEIV